MYYWICIRTDKTMGLFRTDSQKRELPYPDFEYIKHECGMDYAETITFELDDVPYMMLLDEEGKLQNKPINEIATRLWKNPYDVIVGDVAILGYPSGEDMMYLLQGDADYIWSHVTAMIPE